MMGFRSFVLLIAFFLYWKQFLGWTGSMPLGAVSMSACLLSYGPDSLTLYSSWVLLNSHALWVHWNSVLMGHPECYVQVGL